MYQKDYILRMGEMIGDLIAAFLGKLKKGDLEQEDKTWSVRREERKVILMEKISELRRSNASD